MIKNDQLIKKQLTQDDQLIKDMSTGNYQSIKDGQLMKDQFTKMMHRITAICNVQNMQKKETHPKRIHPQITGSSDVKKESPSHSATEMAPAKTESQGLIPTNFFSRKSKALKGSQVRHCPPEPDSCLCNYIEASTNALQADSTTTTRQSPSP